MFIAVNDRLYPKEDEVKLNTRMACFRSELFLKHVGRKLFWSHEVKVFIDKQLSQSALFTNSNFNGNSTSDLRLVQ